MRDWITKSLGPWLLTGALAASLAAAGCDAEGAPAAGADSLADISADTLGGEGGADASADTLGDGASTDAAPIAWACRNTEGVDVEFLRQIGCLEDFVALASEPISTAIPGARSAKTVLDRSGGGGELYFQNSKLYPIHWEFASEHLSLPDHPPVPGMGAFNSSEYFSPSRRFVLGAVTHYEASDTWAWELSPYDTASVEMITAAYRAVRDNSFFGDALRFHPTSAAQGDLAQSLPADVHVISTDEIFEGIDYQPLNLALSMGRLRFVTPDQLDEVDFREIVVLESAPNDIRAVQGIITQAFQTPLSHVNVLSQNRGTPNMGLRDAWQHPLLRPLEGSWVELNVTASGWSIREVTQADADTWWEVNRPEPIDIPMMDTSVSTLTDVEDLLDLETMSLKDALHAAVPIYGGKASHFGALAQIDAVPSPPGFAVPVYYFNQFMADNGLWSDLEALLDDNATRADPVLRAAALEALRDKIKGGEVNADFEARLVDKLTADFPHTRMRFRSSTNAEDVRNFNGAGLYTSKSGDPDDPDKPYLKAVKKVWASVYSDRAFAEREYYGIDHRHIGMALLVHRSFPHEDANGVAITANVFDPKQIDAPAFYINVQEGGASVVLPDPGVQTDQLLYYYQSPNQPTVYLFHSNQIPAGQTVLSADEIHTLSQALDAIQSTFRPVYGQTSGFYGMDVEFKFDSSAGGGSQLYVKQARPYPGWGVSP